MAVPYFSWLDLSATSQYALQNGPSSSGSGGEYDGIGELSPWDGAGMDGSGMDGVSGGFMEPGFLDVGVNGGGGDLIF